MDRDEKSLKEMIHKARIALSKELDLAMTERSYHLAYRRLKKFEQMEIDAFGELEVL